MQKVFISYSWKDETVALRLYRDLKKQKISIWLDRIDGKATGDFQVEFLKVIEGCDHFIVIDSSNYRHKSTWCETELKACFDRIDKQQKVNMIVCLAEADGDWRKPYLSDIKERRELFTRLNAMKYFSIFHDSRYDNDRIYENSLDSIYRILGKESCSWDVFPEESDLIDELDDALRTSRTICDDDIEALRSVLRAIVLRRRQHHDIVQHLDLLENDCRELGLNIFLPRWIKAIWLASNEYGDRHSNVCLECLKSLAEDFPEDSRALRGLGSIYARMGMQQNAVEALRQALVLEESRTDQNNSVQYEILCNLSQAYMNSMSYHDACITSGKALSLIEEDEINIQLFENHYESLLHIGNKSKAGSFIEQMVNKHPTVPELLRAYGCHCIGIGLPETGMPYLTRAYDMMPSTENAFSLLSCLLQCGETVSYRQIRSDSLELPAITEDDIFWKNQIKKLPQI